MGRTTALTFNKGGKTMNKKVNLWACVVTTSCMLLGAPLSYAQDRGRVHESAEEPVSAPSRSDLSSQAISPQASKLTPNDDIPDFDKADIWKVKCAAPTQICADVASFGTFNDNTVYVNVVCNASGKGDMESATGGTISANACAPNCLEATVLFHCDDQTFCDESYNSLLQCVNKSFAAGFPKKTQENN
jgi:hypothetical protein